MPNDHPPWAFSDNGTELYFDSPQHLMSVFRSEWVAQKVGPDGANFSDFSAILPMFVREDVAPLSALSAFQTDNQRGAAFVAMYFVALRDTTPSEVLVSELVQCLYRHAPQEVQTMVVNTPAVVGFDLGAYFGGEPAVRYQCVFTIPLRGKGSVSATRLAQKDFEEKVPSLDLPATWIGFGERAVVLDQTINMQFDASRQPLKNSI